MFCSFTHDIEISHFKCWVILEANYLGNFRLLEIINFIHQKRVKKQIIDSKKLSAKHCLQQQMLFLFPSKCHTQAGHVA